MTSLFGKSVLVVCGIVMASCAAEPFYSCNKEADKWVKEHLDEVHSMGRPQCRFFFAGAARRNEADAVAYVE